MDVDMEFDKTVNFSNYKTFRIVSGDLNAKSALLKNDLVKKNLENEIRMRLQYNHLLEVKSSPDLAIRYSLGASRKADTKVIPTGRLGGRLRVVKTHETEGILTIDILAGDRELIWRTVVIEDNRNPAKVAEKLDKMVQKAFDKYPPK
jgi:hypothetical protein